MADSTGLPDELAEVLRDDLVVKAERMGHGYYIIWHIHGDKALKTHFVRTKDKWCVRGRYHYIGAASEWLATYMGQLAGGSLFNVL